MHPKSCAVLVTVGTPAMHSKTDQQMQSCSGLHDVPTTTIVVSRTVAQPQRQIRPFAWLCLQCWTSTSQCPQSSCASYHSNAYTGCRSNWDEAQHVSRLGGCTENPRNRCLALQAVTVGSVTDLISSRDFSTLSAVNSSPTSSSPMSCSTSNISCTR